MARSFAKQPAEEICDYILSNISDTSSRPMRNVFFHMVVMAAEYAEAGLPGLSNILSLHNDEQVSLSVIVMYLSTAMQHALRLMCDEPHHAKKWRDVLYLLHHALELATYLDD